MYISDSMEHKESFVPICLRLFPVVFPHKNICVDGLICHVIFIFFVRFCIFLSGRLDLTACYFNIEPIKGQQISKFISLRQK